MKIIERMRQRNILFGNDPEEFHKDTADVSSQGRVYFRDPNGHIFEVMA